MFFAILDLPPRDSEIQSFSICNALKSNPIDNPINADLINQRSSLSINFVI